MIMKKYMKKVLFEKVYFSFRQLLLYGKNVKIICHIYEEIVKEIHTIHDNKRKPIVER